MSDPDVDLVVDFLNTVDYGARTELLDQPAAWRTWLGERGLTEGDGDVRAARDSLRVAVGDLAPDVGSPDVAVPHRAVSAAVRVELGELGAMPRLVAVDVVGAVLAAASRLAVLGRWDRVKICPADDCRWAFYDRSRNHSRTWCSMQVCGNREKARTWRERHHVESASGG